MRAHSHDYNPVYILLYSSLYVRPLDGALDGSDDVVYVTEEEGTGDFYTSFDRMADDGRDDALLTTSKTEFAVWNRDGVKIVIRDDLASLESDRPVNLIRGYDFDKDGDADIVTVVMDGVTEEYRLEVITNDSM